jgi:hypothetical protein
LVYYAAGLASLSAFAGAAQLPYYSPFWLVARILLDAVGGLFGLYLVAITALSMAGLVMRRRLVSRRPSA